MKILHVTASLDPRRGGTTTAIRELGAALSSMGMKNVVAAADAAEEDFPGIEVVRGLGRSTGSWSKNVQMGEWLQANAGRFDQVLIHGLWLFPSFAAARCCRRLGIPYRVVPHGMLDRWFREFYPWKHRKKWLYWQAIEKKIVNGARAVVFTSEEEKRRSLTTFPGMTARAEVARLGLEDPPRMEKSASRKRLLFLGRWHEKKRVVEVVRSFAAACPVGDAEFVVAGIADDPAYERRVRKTREMLPPGIRERIRLQGACFGEDKWRLLASASAFILDSAQENFSFSVVEALACSVPVLISDGVAVHPEVEQCGGGWVSKKGDEMEAIIRRWAESSPSELEEKGRRARRCYETFFSRQACGEAWRKILAL
jgi:glycosyltransferase involved in cell wall biosynthesis